MLSRMFTNEPSTRIGELMKSFVKYAGVVIAGVVATTGAAFAAPGGLNVPEPGSMALVGLGIAGLLYFSRKGKK